MASKQLNKNNFLRWFGEFEEVAIENIAVDDVASGAINAGTINILPLVNDTSTVGIDVNTFFFTQQVYTDNPSVWNPIDSTITFYTKSDSVPGAYELKYKWKDLQGNLSNEATIAVTLTARATGWRGYGVPTCALDGGGDKTGYSYYSQLEQYYIDDDAAVIPTSLKDNDPDDPDYIAPVLDDFHCSTATYKLLVMYFTTDSIHQACLNSGTLTNPVNVYINPDDDASNIGRGMSIGDIFYTDSALTIPLSVGFYAIQGYVYSVNGAGVVYNKTGC